MEIIVESERDKRTYDWLLAQVGDAALRDACLSVTGKPPLRFKPCQSIGPCRPGPNSRSRPGRWHKSTWRNCGKYCGPGAVSTDIVSIRAKVLSDSTGAVAEIPVLLT